MLSALFAGSDSSGEHWAVSRQTTGRPSVDFDFNVGLDAIPSICPGLNWDPNLGSAPIKTEDMTRSGGSQRLVQSDLARACPAVRLQEVVRENV